MKEQKKRTAEQTLKLNVASNLVLGVLVLSVGALCLSPMENARQTSGEEAQIYRNAENGKGVSLMFNVYWGTEEVYRILETLARRDVKATFLSVAVGRTITWNVCGQSMQAGTRSAITGISIKTIPSFPKSKTCRKYPIVTALSSLQSAKRRPFLPRPRARTAKRC